MGRGLKKNVIVCVSKEQLLAGKVYSNFKSIYYLEIIFILIKRVHLKSTIGYMDITCIWMMEAFVEKT